MAILIDKCEWIKHHGLKHFSKKVLRKISVLERKITGSSYSGRLRRFVLLSSTSSYCDSAKRSSQIEKLAQEGCQHPSRLKKMLPELVRSENFVVYFYGKSLAAIDGRAFLPCILKEYRRNASHTSVLLSGYLTEVARANIGEWELIVIDLLCDASLRSILPTVISHSGLTDRVMQTILAQGDLDDQFLVSLASSYRLSALEPSVLSVYIERLLENGKVEIVLNLLNSFLSNLDGLLVDDDIVCRVLTTYLTVGTSDNSAEYYWSSVAQEVSKRNPGKRLELLQLAIRALRRDQGVYCQHGGVYEFLSKVLADDTLDAWRIIASEIENGIAAKDCGGILDWLGGGSSDSIEDAPLLLLSRSDVFEWVSIDPDNRAHLLAYAVPRTLSEGSGEWTRELLARYGDSDRVRAAVRSRLGGYLWSGSESEFSRKKREEARSWLEHERSQRVRWFIEDYIDLLSCRIDQAELIEERRI